LFVLKISPPQICWSPRCERLTEYARAEIDPYSLSKKQLDLRPYCSEHFYIDATKRAHAPTAYEQFAITNAVVGHFGGKGFATIVGPCRLDQVPAPYHAETEADFEGEARIAFKRDHVNDLAWLVTYCDEQDQERRVVALWCSDFVCWEVFEFPQLGA
jgi:hypothetical protein